MDAGGAGPAATFDEHEVGEMAVAWMRSGPMWSAVSEPIVEGVEGDVVDGDGAFVVQLAQRDAEPGAVGAVVDEMVELEIEELTDA